MLPVPPLGEHERNLFPCARTSRRMKVAYIHHDKKIHTGAGHINGLFSRSLKARGIRVRHFYPRTPLLDAPQRLKGLNNILFFHSLLEHKQEILRCDIIQGTTYTPLALLPFPIPVISHFGSTSAGFIKAVPRTHMLEQALQPIWHELRAANVIRELNLRTHRPLRDVAEIEHYVAERADAVIATSNIVARELHAAGVPKRNVFTIPNAIDTMWFGRRPAFNPRPSLVYLGRLGHDVFTHKLKGLDRLIATYRAFPRFPKVTIAMTMNLALEDWLRQSIPNHAVSTNVLPASIRRKLRHLRGSILIVPSRYEGFCLSLIEGMSQGLIPVTYPVGIAPEIIEDGKNGYLVHSVEEMQSTIRRLLRNEPLRRRCSIGAIDTAKKFRPEPVAEALHMLFRAVIRRYRREQKAKLVKEVDHQR